MSESHNNGYRFERKVEKLLKKYYEEVLKESIIIPESYTQTGKQKRYTPDHITYDSIWEDKNEGSGGTPEKLTHAVMKMQILGEETGKTPYLIYEGENYHHHIYNDPTTKRAIKFSPNVIILSFVELQKHLFDTMKLIVREDPITLDKFF